MNNYTRIIIVMSILNASCAISKKENERMDQILSEQNKPVEVQIADSLTIEMLAKYESRAIQKLKEFYDFLALIVDNRYDLAMKKEIQHSAIGLFLSSDQIIAPLVPGDIAESSVEETMRTSRQMPFLEPFEIGSIAIDQPLTQISKKVYEGTLTYQLKVGKQDKANIYQKSATFSLRKIEKTLGGESLEVWEVFLNQIQ